MASQAVSTDLTSSSDNKNTTVKSRADSLPTSISNNTNLAEKSEADASKDTLPSTNRKEKSSKGNFSKAKKSKGVSRFKGMGCKGLFSVFLCISTDEKASRREKAASKTTTTTEKVDSLVPSVPLTEETSEEGTVSLNSESALQPEIKPTVDDLIYSASPDEEPQKTITKLDVPSMKKASQISLNEIKPLLEPLTEEFKGKKCLVLDLDETLVHSSFKLVEHPDFIVPVEIDNQIHNVYVAKRPGVDEFLKKVGEIYEVVVFTASLSKYADPVLDMLDIHKVVKHRLFRESCYNHNGNYVKDLSQIGRELKDTIIIDNSPTSYLFHPSNAVPITTWFNDQHDTELLDLIPFLTDLTTVDDVTKVLDNAIDDFA